MSAHIDRADQLAEQMRKKMQRDDTALVRQIALTGIAALFAASAMAIDFAIWKF